jgi:hypothetical protein
VGLTSGGWLPLDTAAWPACSLLLERGDLAPSKWELGGCDLYQLLDWAGESSSIRRKQPQLQVALWIGEHLTGEGAHEGQRHPLTAEVFDKATRFNSVPLLQQLRQRGCPWNETAWDVAVEGGCVAVLAWLHQAGCPKTVSHGRC